MSNKAVRWAREVAGEKQVYIIWLLLIQAFQGALVVASAWMMRGMIDNAVAKDEAGFLRYALIVVAIVAANIAVNALNRWLIEYSNSVLNNRFKKRLFDNLLRHNYGEVTATHSGEWLNRMTSDTAVVTGAMISIVPSLTGMLVKLVGAFILLVAIAPKVLMIIIPLGIVVVLCTTLLRGKLKSMHKDIQKADGRVRVFIQERLANLLIVKTYSREESSSDMAWNLMSEHQNARMKRVRLSNILNTGFSFAMRGAYIGGAIYCGYGILHGILSYGTFVAVLQLINQVQSPFANITGLIPQFYAAVASAERLMEVEDYADDGSADECLSPADIKKFYDEEFVELGLRNAGFKYEQYGEGNNSQIVIEDYNISIKKGEYIAITGHSGSGKSTVLKLLMSLYELDSGERYIRTSDGEKPLTAAYRGLYAYVPQGNQLMSGTIREIITWGDPDAMKDKAGIDAALKIACADGFARELENGIDTILGEGGSGLSEGQMQRIAIARAIYSEHPILLLDEATSSLDAPTEARLLKNIHEMTDKTVILATHTKSGLLCDKSSQ